ncbi:MAG: hypothetical protein R2699_11860 [Acidimicrobiales bacterium]
MHHDPDGYTYVIEVPEGHVGTSPLVIQARCVGALRRSITEGPGSGVDTGLHYE